eukprot:Sspe_Gene.92935::Locus_65680_Transcript_2_2_Confidence_0.800_Length_923::g.92935::m.92935
MEPTRVTDPSTISVVKRRGIHMFNNRIHTCQLPRPASPQVGRGGEGRKEGTSDSIPGTGMLEVRRGGGGRRRGRGGREAFSRSPTCSWCAAGARDGSAGSHTYHTLGLGSLPCAVQGAGREWRGEEWGFSTGVRGTCVSFFSSVPFGWPLLPRHHPYHHQTLPSPTGSQPRGIVWEGGGGGEGVVQEGHALSPFRETEAERRRALR